MQSQAHYTEIGLVFYPMKKTTIPERIELIKKQLGIVEDVEFGKRCGMTKSVVNQLKTEKMKSVAARYAYKLEDSDGICARWFQLGEGSMLFDPDIRRAEKIMSQMTPARRKDAVKIIAPLVEQESSSGEPYKHATQ